MLLLPMETLPSITEPQFAQLHIPRSMIVKSLTERCPKIITDFGNNQGYCIVPSLLRWIDATSFAMESMSPAPMKTSTPGAAGKVDR